MRYYFPIEISIWYHIEIQYFSLPFMNSLVLTFLSLFQVLAAFYSHGGHETNKAEEKLLAKFDKKINKNPNLKVQKDRVKLIS